jgi:predicted nucleic acid-binding protein
MLYLDTSALLKLYVLEAGSEWVQQQVIAQEDPLPIWEIQEYELTNALHLKVFWKELSKKQSAEQQELFQSRKRRGLYVFPEIDRSSLMERFRALSRHTMKSGFRTLDVLHVACAQELKVSGFLSFDQRQLAVAKACGLPVMTEKS